MDPNENLEEQLRVAKELNMDPSDVDAANYLADLVLAMDGWLSNGGFLPERWEKKGK